MPAQEISESEISKWQGYVRHKAGLDHHRNRSNHWAAETHGEKSESPAARNDTVAYVSLVGPVSNRQAGMIPALYVP